MITHQKLSEPTWLDEAGNAIPTNRLTSLEKLSEKTTLKLLKGAQSINQKLIAFKEEVETLCDQVYQESLLETKTEGKKRKGNFTFFNFNRTIKVEVSISERIEFDDLTIQACQEKLNELIDQGTKEVDSFLKGIIMDAFQKSNGSLDAKKVIGLKKHKARTKNPLYHEAMELLDQSIRRPDSKRYFRIFVKNEEGKYDYVDLNFSSL